MIMRVPVFKSIGNGLLYATGVKEIDGVSKEIWFHDSLPSIQTVYPMSNIQGANSIHLVKGVGTVEIEPWSFEEWFEQSDEDQEYISVSRTAWYAALEMGR